MVAAGGVTARKRQGRRGQCSVRKVPSQLLPLPPLLLLLLLLIHLCAAVEAVLLFLLFGVVAAAAAAAAATDGGGDGDIELASLCGGEGGGVGDIESSGLSSFGMENTMALSESVTGGGHCTVGSDSSDEESKEGEIEKTRLSSRLHAAEQFRGPRVPAAEGRSSAAEWSYIV